MESPPPIISTTSTAVGPSKLADPKLLDKIDKLFALNIGEYVELPQLVVVGDQSSGKSSVLEGLTGIAFPRNSGLCTRFATQIVFRRSPATNVQISIIPAAGAQAEHAEKVRAWKKNDAKLLEQEKFGQILGEVSQVMGIGGAQSEGGSTKSFTDDVLRIEIHGPEQEHLSVIDVPGIFRSPTEGVTTKSDMEMVKAMVLSYMKNARSVILAVVPANTDFATQDILQLAQPYDPEGQRTLGVLTKPDLVDEGAEQNVLNIIEGKSNKLALGWYVVRNPGQKDLDHMITKAGRQMQEKIFFNRQHPWTRVEKDKAGTDALRSRLVEILGEMVQREFSKVKSEIGNHLRTTKKELDNLGPAREDRTQQHIFLLDLASKFQSITSSALRADYGRDGVFESHPELKLATAVVDRNSAFSDDVHALGHTYIFKADAEDLKSEGVKSEDGPSLENEDENGKSEKSQPKNRKRESGHPELDDIVDEPCTVAYPVPGAIMPWLTKTYNSSRGFELGTFEASILPTVWRQQSTKWDVLATGYISDLVDIIHNFSLSLLSVVCSDDRVRRELLSVLSDDLLSRYNKGVDFARFLLKVEREGTPLTTNHYFSDNLEKSQQARFKARLEAYSFNIDNDRYGNKKRVVDIEAIMGTTGGSNAEHTICDIHDILYAYYKVARKRFVDNVCMQAADHHLVTGPDSPIKVFSPSFVGKLSEEQLETIAGEESSTKRKRTQLKRDIENLEQARKILG